MKGKELMKGLISISLLTCSIFLSACGNSESSGNASSVSQEALNEQDPLAFVQNYVEHVQRDADKELYAKFMHPSVREELDAGSKMAEMLYQNAMLENPAIASSDALTRDARVKLNGDAAMIRFQFDESVAFQKIYPNSPFAGEGLIIRSGQVNLQRYEDRWGIVGHSLDGE